MQKVKDFLWDENSRFSAGVLIGWTASSSFNESGNVLETIVATSLTYLCFCTFGFLFEAVVEKLGSARSN